mmetsp:Transcript_38525/g.56540  ORF Transcript_38525/g.56540 Transcript_38525/m.56540 type:complete len:108 (-) Transcript_38525:109-432(-)
MISVATVCAKQQYLRGSSVPTKDIHIVFSFRRWCRAALGRLKPSGFTKDLIGIFTGRLNCRHPRLHEILLLKTTTASSLTKRHTIKIKYSNRRNKNKVVTKDKLKIA